MIGCECISLLGQLSRFPRRALPKLRWKTALDEEALIVVRGNSDDFAGSQIGISIILLLHQVSNLVNRLLFLSLIQP